MPVRATIEGVGFSERAHYYCTEQALEVTLRHMGYELEDILYDLQLRFVQAKRRGGRPA